MGRSRGFKPGFRLSLIDAVVIVRGAVGSFHFWPRTWWVGFIIAFVVGHFFLFCNVFRIARRLELVWASVFCALTLCTIVYDFPAWTVTVAASLVTTAVTVGIEMKTPPYHGVGWRRINPNLRQWWDASMIKRE